MQQKTVIALLGTVAIAATGLVLKTSTSYAEKSASPKLSYALDACGVKGTQKKKTAVRADVRKSAQKGLTFLVNATTEWQEKNNCMGCHVQGVAGEAVAVGLSHQYEVSDYGQKTIYKGLLDLSGGLRTEIGHASKGGSLRDSTRAFGGASIARYDELIDQKYSDDLLTAAFDLLEAQDDSGAISRAYNHGPVAAGPVQGTYQAIQTWRQAYERSADERWLNAIQRSETYLQKTVTNWDKTPTTDVQLINYAMLGMIHAGVGTDEASLQKLKSQILELQNNDGSWTEPLQGKNALTTGQTIYTLRQFGMNDSDSPIKKGINYLIKTQQKDGGWSDSGSEKGEAMWAVLGLVSTKVTSINITGIQSGQHAKGVLNVRAAAKNNDGQALKGLEILVDDIVVATHCGDSNTYAIDTTKLGDGIHTLDVLAVDAKNRKTRRRVSFYSGDHFITNLGTRFTQNKTQISFRDIAANGSKHKLKTVIYKADDTKRKTPVFEKVVDGKQGPHTIAWERKDKKDTHEFIARVEWTDAKGKVRHSEELPFVHANRKFQEDNYSQVTGNIGFAESGDDMENAVVELVDEEGQVVQRANSTRSGSFNFRNIDKKKKYKVRVSKKGRKAKEMNLEPAAAPKQTMDFDL